MKLFLSILIFSIVGLFTLEIVSYILTKNNLFLMNRTPKLYSSIKDTTGAWRTEKDLWGAWHKPNAKAHHERSCFNVIYQSNEVGARDSSFMNLSGESWVLLGDSFAEGYGVELKETSQFQIERKTNINLLNFGSGGHFGPLQQLIIYKKLASKFPHTGVIIFFLPANDFTDNDYLYWKDKNLIEYRGRIRYRPYFNFQTENVLLPFYPPTATKVSEHESGPIDFFDWKKILHENFWFSNALITAKRLFSYKQEKSSSGNYYAGYFDSKIYQQKAVVRTINELIKIAGNRKVMLVSIPAKRDIERFLKGQTPFDQYWYQSFKNFSDENSNFSFFDLLIKTNEAKEELFFSCDPHWSAYGNMWAADLIAKHIKKVTDFNE